MIKATLENKQNIQLKIMESEDVTGNLVKVKVYACAICGSDLPRFFFGKVHYFPIVLGHEFAGIVETCGSAVKNLKKGDKVAVVPLLPCGKCSNCHSGNFSLCQNYRFVGSSVDGGLATEIILPESNLYRLSKEIQLDDAVYFEVSTVALHAVRLLGSVSNKTLAIWGTGAVGLMAAQWGKLLGANEVILVGRGKSESKQAIANKIGAIYVDGGDIKQRETIEQTCDLVVDAVAESDSIEGALALTKASGVIVLVGTPKANVNISSKAWALINRKELKVKGSWMGYSSPFPGSEWQATEEALKDGVLQMSELLTREKFALEDVQKAFSSFSQKKERLGRTLVICNKGLV